MAVLEKIRVRMGAFITVLIAVALLSFVIDPTTLQSAMSMFSSKYDVGEIAGEGISYQEYQQKVDHFTQVYQMTSGSTSSDEQTQELINNTAWQNEVTERVLIPAIEKAGVTLGAEELYDLTQGTNISPVLMQDASFVDENGQFSRTRVAQFVQAISQDQSGQLGMYWNYLEDNIVKSQKVEKYLSLLQHSMYMNPVELNRAIAENNVSYNVDFVVQPFGFSMDSTITVTDAEAKKYYEENKALIDAETDIDALIEQLLLVLSKEEDINQKMLMVIRKISEGENTFKGYKAKDHVEPAMVFAGIPTIKPINVKLPNTQPLEVEHALTMYMNSGDPLVYLLGKSRDQQNNLYEVINTEIPLEQVV